MIKTSGKKSARRKQREALRKSFVAPPWGIWTATWKDDVMASSDSRDHMLERHRLVVALIEVNSQQLRCESAAAGLDIERLIARRDLEQKGTTREACDALAAIERRTAEIEEKKRKLNQERDWLESSLSEFSAVSSDKSAIAKDAIVRKPS